MESGIDPGQDYYTQDYYNYDHGFVFCAICDSLFSVSLLFSSLCSI